MEPSPVTGSWMRRSTVPGSSSMLKQMASSFSGTWMMKWGSPSTVDIPEKGLACGIWGYLDLLAPVGWTIRWQGAHSTHRSRGVFEAAGSCLQMEERHG